MIFGWFGRNSGPAQTIDQPTSASPSMPGSSALPYELVAAIDAARVVWRTPQAGQEDRPPIVHVVGLGSWNFDDVSSAAYRVARAYPELSRAQCTRAGKLILAQIGRRNRNPRNRLSSISPIDREYYAFMQRK